jgi:hypothetical protein
VRDSAERVSQTGFRAHAWQTRGSDKWIPTSFIDFAPQLAPISAPSIFDLLFCITSIISGGDHGQGALDLNQDNRSDFKGEPQIPIHLAPALKDLIGAMDNSSPLESIPLTNERIDDVDFNGRVALDVLNRAW